MALIINIETATKNCSVSLAENAEVIAVKELNTGDYSHAEKLHVFIEEVVKSADKSLEDISAIAISKGPGSFTGLRIGVSAAKGLCFALDIPLISTETLESLAIQAEITDGIIVPMLDARRMEVYSTIYDASFRQLRDIEAEVIGKTSFETYLKNGKVYFIGDGASKCKEVLTHSNAIFIDDKFPSAIQMATISFKKFEQSIFENVAYFEPYYLKDFLVTPSKKK